MSPKNNVTDVPHTARIPIETDHASFNEPSAVVIWPGNTLSQQDDIGATEE